MFPFAFFISKTCGVRLADRNLFSFKSFSFNSFFINTKYLLIRCKFALVRTLTLVQICTGPGANLHWYAAEVCIYADL